MSAKEYYKLEEVMRLLGKSRSTILREAKAGDIPSELDIGKVKGRKYPKHAIDVLVERAKRRSQKKPPKLLFSYSTLSDSWAEVEIGRELYGDEDIVPYETLLEWRDKNDEIYMSLKDNGRVVGYSSCMPLDESIVLPLLEDRIRERDIPGSSIKSWIEPDLSIYVASVTVKPSGSALIDGVRGELMLKHTLNWALALQRQYEIKNWYGIGATAKGQHLFEALGFKEIVTLYGGARKGYYLNNKDLQPVHILRRMLERFAQESGF